VRDTCGEIDLYVRADIHSMLKFMRGENGHSSLSTILYTHL
jgi:hypothetical protein